MQMVQAMQMVQRISVTDTGDVLILINTGDTAVTRRLPDSVAEYTNLGAALYTGDRNSLINDREITVPAGGILFLQKP